jgi:hypothetical protein
MSVDSAAKPRAAEPSSVRFNVSAIALVLLLAGLALAYAIDAASRDARRPAHRADSETMLTRTIGGKELTIPLSWFRYAEQSAAGFAKQVDLHLVLPLGPGAAAGVVEVTLLPRSTVRPSAKLLDGVYLHMFEETQLEGPVGLVGKPLSGKDGYKGEVVWYDPISADPFVAKCSPPIAAGAASSCLRTVHLAPGIAAIYSFSADLLANWREFDPQMRERLARIGVF